MGGFCLSKYYKIKSWEKYQHRDHKKTMPWIKLHVSLLDDPDFMQLSDKNKLSWITLLIYSGRTGGRISKNCGKLKARLGINRKPDLALFESLGWIEPYSEENSARSERAEDAPKPRLDKIREDKTRQERPKGAENSLKKQSNKISKGLEFGDTKKLIMSTQGKVDSPHPINIMETWNKHKGDLPEIKSMTKKRLSLWRKRYLENPQIDYWIDCIQKLSKSKFCAGENDRGWKASIDFLLREDVHLKIQEGLYETNMEKKPYIKILG